MGPIEIILIIACVLIIGGVFGTYVYKRAKGLPTGDCGCCAHSSKKKGNKMLKEYHKMYPKDADSSCCNNGGGCCCHCQDHKDKPTQDDN